MSTFTRYTQRIRQQALLPGDTIKVIRPQNLKVAEPISHTQLMVCLEPTSIAGLADALKVYSGPNYSLSAAGKHPRS